MKQLWKRFLRWFHQEDLTALINNKLLTKEDVMNVLNQMDKTDPIKRKLNIWDENFVELIPILHQYDEALEILNKYGNLCSTYFQRLYMLDPEHNEELQRRLCAVEYNEILKKWIPKYANLLFWLSKSYELLPEVKKTLFEKTGDEKYK